VDGYKVRIRKQKVVANLSVVPNIRNAKLKKRKTAVGTFADLVPPY